jgi:hypothetical protein
MQHNTAWVSRDVEFHQRCRHVPCDEMAIACTGYARRVACEPCERCKRNGEEAFTANADSERSVKSEIGVPKVRSDCHGEP